MARNQCWAHDPETKLRCNRAGGHSGDHKVVKEFTDNTVWVPVMEPVEVLAERHLAAVPALPTIPDDPEDTPVPVGECVVCQHTDEHLTVEEAGDGAGCQHTGCMCLTAVRV